MKEYIASPAFYELRSQIRRRRLVERALRAVISIVATIGIVYGSSLLLSK
jgi:hypothetical protein